MHGCTEIKFEGQISKNGGEPVKLSASCEAETECGGVSFEESLIYVGFDAKALGFSEKGESSDDFWWKDEENEEDPLASFIVDLKEEMKDIFCCNSHEVDELWRRIR